MPQTYSTKVAHQSANFQICHCSHEKLLMSFLEPRAISTSNTASLFSVMLPNSSVLFHLKRYMLWTKGAHQSTVFQIFDWSKVHSIPRRRGVVVITTAQLHSTKPEIRFCAGSNPARGVSEIRDGEDLWQWSRLKIRLNAFRRSTIPQKQFITIIIIILMPLLKLQGQGLFKHRITVQCHER